MLDINSIEYYSMPEKHKVVAIIRGVEFDAAEDMFRKAKYHDCFAPSAKEIRMPSMMKATAYCHPNDEWNEVEGRQVAKKRLLKMYHNIKASTMKRYLDKLQAFVDSAMKIQAECRESAHSYEHQ